MKIKIHKFTDNIKKPRRAHYNDAGLDIYSPIDLVIDAGATETIPLGFGLDLPDGLMGNILPRSGHAKLGIVPEMPPIDSGYKGEIHAIITNMSNRPFRISAHDRICQLVIMPVVYAELVEDPGDERGDGAFGSTGK